MTSTVDIANSALNLLGASNIAAFDENSKAARVINQKYPSIRDELFRQHSWNCLVRRTTLAQSATTPDFGYAYYYPLPTDPYCLRVLEFSNGTMSYPQDNMHSLSGGPVFVVEGRNIVTDESTAKIKYIARIEDPNEYDASLIDTLSQRLAAEIAYTVTGSGSVRNQMRADYIDKLSQARNVNATEGAPQRIEATDFIEARM